MSLRVGLFGGTFDPVHNGHLSIAQSFIDSGLLDELWVLLTLYPPHKQQIHQTSYENRLKMLEAAFKNMDRLTINTIESKLPKPSYSIHTIRYLEQKYPDAKFYYCMGEDSLTKFHTWKYYDEILEECELLVAKRPGVEHQNVKQEILDRTHFVEHTPLDISSSQIRELVSKGKPVSELVPEKVSRIIEKEQLYS